MHPPPGGARGNRLASGHCFGGALHPGSGPHIRAPRHHQVRLQRAVDRGFWQGRRQPAHQSQVRCVHCPLCNVWLRGGWDGAARDSPCWRSISACLAGAWGSWCSTFLQPHISSAGPAINAPTTPTCRGTFVLRDVQFSWLEALHPNQLPPWLPGMGSRGPSTDGALPSPASPQQPTPGASPSPVASHAVLPCALLRGALSALGLEATVTLDASSLPQADFTVVLRPPGGSWTGQD